MKAKGITFLIPWEGKDSITMNFMKSHIIEMSKIKGLEFIISINENQTFNFDWISEIGNVNLVKSNFKKRIPLVSEAMPKIKTDFFSILDLDDSLDCVGITNFINSEKYSTKVDAYRNKFYPLVDGEKFREGIISSGKPTYFYSGVKWFITANSTFNSNLINKKLIKSLKKIDFMAYDDVVFALAISSHNNKSLKFEYNEFPFYYHLIFDGENHSSPKNGFTLKRLRSLEKAYRYISTLKQVGATLKKDFNYCTKLLICSIFDNANINDYEPIEVKRKFNFSEKHYIYYKSLYEERAIKTIDENVINFVIFSNLEMINQTEVLINSINKLYKESELKIHLGLTSDCEHLVRYFRMKKIDVQIVDDYIDNPNEIVYDHVKRVTFSRLFMFDIFPTLLNEKNKRIMYLDVDTILLKRIDKRKYFDYNKNIAFTDMPNDEEFDNIKGWLEWRLSNTDMLERNLAKLKGGSYFNAGVIVINDKLKIKKLFEKCINSNLITDDQNLLNFFNYDEIEVWKDTTLNFQPFKEPFKDEVSLVHFAGPSKPWTNNFDKHKNHIDFEKIKTIYSQLRRKVKILILEENSEQIVMIKNALIDNEKLSWYADITLSKQAGFKPVENWSSRENVVWSNNPKNREIISKYDIVLSQSYFVHYAPDYVKDNETTTIIELFHGTIVKDPSNLTALDNKVDYFLSPNEYTTQVLRDLGYNEQFILKYGYPRIDYYLSVSGNNLTKSPSFYNEYLSKKIGLENFNKNIILFAPSWINTKENGELIRYDVNIDSLLENLDEEKDVLIISKHWNTEYLKNIDYVYSEKYKNLVLESGVDFEKLATYKIMMSADKMITDYSSVIFDFGTLKGFDKIDFFNPITDKYQSERTKERYKRTYGTYGMFNSKFDNFFDIDKKQFDKQFEFYETEFMNSTNKFEKFIFDLVIKKYKIKNQVK